MKSKILILSLVLSVAVSLQAQEEDKQVSMLLDFVAWGKDLSGVEVLDGKSGTPVTAQAFRYSKPFKYVGPQTLSLALSADFENAVKEQAEIHESQLRENKTEGIDSSDRPSVQNTTSEVKGDKIPAVLALAREKNPSVAALVSLPADSRRVTILLAPGPQRSLIPHVIDDDPSRHPLGKIRIHNLSKYPISLRTNSKNYQELLPAKNFIASAPDGILAYELAYQIEGKWKVQENNLINIGNSDQLHMVVLNNTSSFFTSSDGSKGGFMQVLFLRRTVKE